MCFDTSNKNYWQLQVEFKFYFLFFAPQLLAFKWNKGKNWNKAKIVGISSFHTHCGAPEFLDCPDCYYMVSADVIIISRLPMLLLYQGCRLYYHIPSRMITCCWHYLYKSGKCAHFITKCQHYYDIPSKSADLIIIWEVPRLL